MLIAPALFVVLASRCAPEVASGTLAAVAGVESGFDPLAIRDNTTGRSVVASDATKAVTIATRLIAAGHSVDLGLMQIDSANLAPLGLSVAAAFDACTSIRAAGRLLTRDYRASGQGGQTALLAALSRYNTGNAWLGFQNGYVRKVVTIARQIVPAIDPSDLVASPRSGTATANPDRGVFGATPTAPSTASLPSHTSTGAPSWDVFPDSIGPAGFAREHQAKPVTLTAHRIPAATGKPQPSAQDSHGQKIPRPAA